MSREIKFRGMSVDGWIYGYYVIMQDDFGNVTPTIYNLKTNKFIPVEEETVGQYTGIKDKNGKEIYEGDIVQCTCGDCKCFRYVVNYQNGAFCLNDIEFPIGSWIMNFEHLQDLKVIGNIYENEELLENE